MDGVSASEDPTSSGTRHTRTLEEVETVLELSKLDLSELLPTVQCVSFSPDLDNTTVKLLELDPSVLDTLTAGDEVVIRGEKSDSAVLCTRDKTFELKEAETSNALLLLDKLEVSADLPRKGNRTLHFKEVTSVLSKYYELRQIKPRVKRLRALLEENVYSGAECEEDNDHTGHKYTMAELLEVVQASQGELLLALEKMGACLLDGCWRLLDPDLLSKVVNHVVQLCEENDWLQTGIPLEQCLVVLQELFPRAVLEHVITKFADLKPGAEGEEDKVFLMNEDRVCRFFAEFTLRNAGQFNLTEFLQVWQMSVPSGMKTNLTQVEGLALINRKSRPHVISYFPAEELSEDPGERCDVLFKAREKWTLEEITPYLIDLTTPKVGVGALLLKYARGSQQNGIKVYNSKKPLS